MSEMGYHQFKDFASLPHRGNYHFENLHDSPVQAVLFGIYLAKRNFLTGKGPTYLVGFDRHTRYVGEDPEEPNQ